MRAFVLACFLALALAGVARAQAEEELAERYAPVVRLVEQEEECGPGEPYEPIDVDAILDEDTVSLRGPWRSNDLVEIAPSGDDLGRGLYEYNLDFPGDALNPGCAYELWARRITEDTEPTVYAHVAQEAAYPDRLALQYWLYYPFNDWNNLHEGDWEMIQLVFPAESAEEALEVEPLEVGYSQHEGAERAEWGEDKLEVVDGTHPVVYPAAGSHANFYSEGLFLGRSAASGVGCDDTTGPHEELRPQALSIPSDPEAAAEAFPWVAFEGRWGERQQAFYNGPTGPNLKAQWTEPITWAEDWRDRSYAVPAGGSFGTDATDFFCGAVEAGSNFVLRVVDNGARIAVVLAFVAALVVFLLTRTSWRPSTPLRVGRRRSWGQAFTASWRMYILHPRLFLAIGLVVIPISLVITGIQAVLFSATSLVGIDPNAEGGGFRVGLAVWIGTVLTLLALALVQAACARAIAAIDAGREVRRPRRLPPGVRQRLGAARGAGDRRRGSHAALHLGLPRADRDLARRPLGAARSGRGARGAVRSGRAAAEWSARPPAVAEGGHARRGRRGDRDRVRTADRRAPDPSRRRAVRACQRHRRARLRRGDAVRGHRDDVRLLRHARPRAPRRARAGARRASSRDLGRFAA